MPADQLGELLRRRRAAQAGQRGEQPRACGVGEDVVV
jgi:hypothetical protein